MSALIYNFTCEITKLLWQRFLYLSTKMALKDAAGNLNKSTINWVRVFENWCNEDGKNPEMVRPDQLDKVLERLL